MKRNNLQLEIVAEYLERAGKQRYTFYTVKNKYGLCKIRKDKYLSGQCPTIRSALDKDSYFKKMLYEKHKETIICIEPYINDSTKLKFQCEYGHIFSKTPNEALRAVICPCCFGYHKTTREVVEILEKKYSNYTYPNFFYLGTKYKSFVDCKDHGVFLANIANLLNSSSGCPECAKIFSGFTLTSFKNACGKNNNGLGVFYIIKCFNESEEFYKLGITSKSVETRYANKYTMPYKYEIVQEVKDKATNIFKLERYLKKYITALSFRYTPDIIFQGSLTECFKLE